MRIHILDVIVMMSNTIRDVCIGYCDVYLSSVMEGGTKDVYKTRLISDISSIKCFYQRFGDRIDYSDNDPYSIPFDVSAHLFDVEMDEKQFGTIESIFNLNLNIVKGPSSDVVGSVMMSALDIAVRGGDKVLMLVPDDGKVLDVLERMSPELRDVSFHLLAHDEDSIERMERLDWLWKDFSDGTYDEEGLRIIEDSISRVKNVLDSMYRERISEDIRSAKVVLVTPAALFSHLAPLEMDDLLSLDIDRIFVHGAESINLIETLPLFTFDIPISMFYGPNPPSSYWDGVPDGCYPFLLSSEYAESMLFDSDNSMRARLAEGTGPHFWKFNICTL